MKNVLALLMVMCALTMGAQVSTTIRIPSSPVAIMDPEVTDPAGFEHGLTIEEVGGVKYFRMPLNGWNGWSHFPELQIPEEATHFKVSARYDEGTSGVPAGNGVTYFQLWSPDWSLAYGMAEGESSVDFREYSIPLNLTGPAGLIQIAVQDRTNGYQAVTGAYIYFGRLEAYTEGTPEYHVAFEAAAGTRSVTILTEVAWSLTSDQPWLTLEKTSGSGSDVVNLTVTAQTAGEERSAVVTIHADGYDDQQLVVTQYGGITEFHAEDLAVLKTIRDNARTNITAPLVNIWNDLLSPADWPGVTWGAEVPRRVIALNVRSKGISWMDVTPLEQLEQLICSSNQITFLNVTGLEYLSWLDASSNSLPEINLTGLRSLRTLRVRINQIQALVLNGLYGLKRLDVDNNRLTSLDLTPLNTLDTLNVASNELKILNTGSLAGLDVLTLASNRLQLSGLPLPAFVTSGSYVYAPQKLVFDELTIESGTVIDYGNEALINGMATAFSWYKDNALIEGATSSTYTPTAEGYYFCQMTNATFPGLTIETKPVRVGNPVTIDPGDLAVLKGIRDGAPTNVSQPLASIWADSRDPLTWSGVTWSEQLPRKVTRLSLSSKGLNSLDVTALDQLVYLSCPGNQMTSLNVTNLANLTTLYTYSNLLGSISLVGLPNLTTLSCYSNQLNSLILSDLSKLTYLSINYNQFTSLDLTEVPNLTSLYCSGNQLTTLDLTPVPNLKTLNCSNNQITHFMGGENLLLTQAIVSGNRLIFSHLFLPSNVTAYTFADQNPVFEEQTVDPGTLLDFSSEAMINGVATVYSWYKDNTLIPGEEAATFAPMEEGYYSCRMTNGTFPGLTLETKSVKVGNPASFDPEDLAALKAIRDAASTEVGDPLATIWADSVFPLTWPGVSWSEVKPHKVIRLDVGYKGVTSLNVNALDRLKELMCDGNQITSLHLAHLSELEVVSAGDNPLASFITEGLSALVDLYIFSTPMTSLDLTGLSGLDYVYLRDNQLASIDLTPVPQLKYFYAANNQLTTLTIPSGLALTATDLSGNILPFSQLIPINKVLGTYNFLNQRPVFEALTIEAGTPVNYSSEALVNGVATTFVWYVGGIEIPGEVSSTYTPAEEGYYFCRMTNTAFPGLTLETKSIQVGNPPTIDPEDLAALKAIRNAASTSVSNPLATIWADGIDPLTWPGVTWTSQPTHRVISLDVSNKGISTMDVTALDQLQQLYVYNNKLTSLDLTGLVNLYRISCYENQLTTLDLSGLSNLRYIDSDANQLTSLAGGGTLSLYGVNLSINRLPFSQLFIPSQVRDWYYFQPQLPVFEERTVDPGTVIDFSSEATINGVATVYSWFKNNELIPDATSSTYTPMEEGYYFCRMTNETFPGLTIETKTIQVGNPPDFDPEDLAALKVIRDDASTTVSDPLATIWADSVDPLNWPGVTWSEQKPRKVTRLEVSYKGIPSMDVTALDRLQQLYCYGNQMTSLQVAHLANLTYLNASQNQLTSLSIEGLTALGYLYVYSNKLTSINLTGLSNLWQLDCQNNQLTSLDLTGLTNLRYFYVGNNQLATLAGRNGLTLWGVYLYTNRLPFSQLFIPSQVSDWYNSQPQLPVFEERTVDPGTVIDFSSEATINGVATVFSWYKNNVLIPDATSSTYTPMEEGYYFCRMTNETFPGLTIETKTIQVGNPPDFDPEDLAALKVIRDAASTTVSDPLATIWADSVDPLNWPGVTWSAQKPYRVIKLQVNYKGVPSMDLTALDLLNELYCYGNQMTSLQVANLANLTYIQAESNQLESLSLAGLASLGGLTVYNNKLTSLDVVGLSGLSSLNVTNNQLTSLDLTGLSNLNILEFGNNQLTSLDVTPTPLLNYFYGGYNHLTVITGVGGLNNLYGVNLSGNNLPFSQLVLPSKVSWEYYYGDQRPVFEERTIDPGTVIDFSSEATINGVATVFSWFKNNELIPDATSSTYTPMEEGYYFCRMTNETFPGLTIETKTIQVGNPPDFDPEDLAALKVIRDAASTTVSSPLATIWADSVDPLTWPGVTWSEAKPWRVIGLNIISKGILNLDVTALDQLSALSCQENQMTSLLVSNLAKLTFLNASDNQLSALSLTGVSKLESLILGNNRLLSLDLTSVRNLRMLFCYNNLLTTLSGWNDLVLSGVFIQNNHLALSQLILPSQVSSNYFYQPQLPVFEERTVDPGTVIDFSSEATINGVATVFSWYKNNVLIPDATSSTYTPTEEGYYFCRMTNETFSGLTIETKVIQVGTPPDFDPEDLAALQAIRDAASTEVPDPLAVTWADSVDPLTWPGVTWSEQKPRKVIRLEVPYKGIPSMDVTALDWLQQLYCYGNQLTSLDLTGLSNLNVLDFGNNQLTSLDVTPTPLLNYFYGGYNHLTVITGVGGLNNLYGVNLSGNNLPFSQLVLPSKVSWEYYYGDQRPVFEERTIDPGTVIDFSSEATINGVATVFSWYKNNALIDGATSSNYTPMEEGYYFCRMTNETFPGLTIETKTIQVGNPPDFDPEDLAALKVIRDAASTTVSDPLATIWADSVDPLNWPGVTWSEQKPRKVTLLEVSYKGIPSMDVTALDWLQLLYCNGNQMTSLQVAHLANLTYLNASENQLTSLDMTGLSTLFYLDCSSNQLTSLDLTTVSQIRYLFIYYNKITNLTGGTVPDFWYVSLHYNHLPFSQLPLTSKVPYSYIYSPQNKVFEKANVALGETIAYPSEQTINGITTFFTWYRDGVEIPEAGNSYSYTPDMDGFYHCTMTNESFPGLTLTTNAITVGEPFFGYDLNDLAVLLKIRDTMPYWSWLKQAWADEMKPGEWPNVTWTEITPGEPKRVTSLYLTWLDLTTLDVLGLSELRSLTCYGNQLTSLDLTGLSKLEVLDCQINALTGLELGHLTNLVQLYCNNNRLTSLDISSNVNLQNVGCSNNMIPFSQMLVPSGSLNVQGFPQNPVFMDYVYTEGNPIAYPSEVMVGGAQTTFTWYKNNEVVLENDITGSFSPDGEGWYYCVMTNSLFGGNTIRTYPVKVGNPVEYDPADVAILIAIRDAAPENSPLKQWWADVSNIGNWPRISWDFAPKKVINLNLSSAGLTTLEVSGLSKLVELQVFGNQMSALSVHDLPVLTFLTAENNQLTSLTLFNLPRLVTLYAQSNLLTSLDVSGLPNLYELVCNYNRLSSLILNGNLQNWGNLTFDNNFLRFSEMPLRQPDHWSFSYNPQGKIFEEKTIVVNTLIDYSSEAMIDGEATLFRWYRDRVLIEESLKSALINAADQSGTYLPQIPGVYHCEMTNAKFPDLILVTNDVTVIEIPIVAHADMAVSNNGYTGQSGVLNVLDNDLVNGMAIVPGTVTLTVTVPEPNGYLLLNGDGSVDIAAGTPAGTYSLTYQICEVERPENCATATVTVQIDERPDITLTVTVSPNIMTGSTAFSVVVKISELNGVDAEGQIVVYIPREKRWSIQTFDPTLTDYQGAVMKNGEWTMSADESRYLFTTTVPVQGRGSSSFVFIAKWSGDNTRGKATLTTQILSAGNEVKVSNNTDSEVLNYFAQ